MDPPIPGVSRWTSRPANYTLSDCPTDPSRFNVLIYLGNVTSDDVSEALTYQLSTIQDIGVDFDYNGQATLLKGNMAAGQLMYDYDNTITFGRNLVNIFELNTSTDMDWIGTRLYYDFGDGWSGTPEYYYPQGMKFTKRSKQEVFSRALDLARLGWQIRVSFSSPVTSR